MSVPKLKIVQAPDVPLTLVMVQEAVAAANFPKDCTVPNAQFVGMLPFLSGSLQRDTKGVYVPVLCCNVRPAKG
jgi:hypothetical protein